MSILDENLIATLEQSLRQSRNAQNRLVSRLREVEEEASRLRQEIEALENSAQQTGQAIDSLLTTVRRSGRGSGLGSGLKIENTEMPLLDPQPKRGSHRGSVAYISNRGAGDGPSVIGRFSDRTITQACTLILREQGRALHVNELYQMLLDGGMQFTGNNPTISIAVSLNRNRRFCKVAPGTFDLVIKDASQAAS